MTELHVQLPGDVAEQLATEAAERGLSVERLALQVLTGHTSARRRSDRIFGFLAIGHSGHHDLSERVKEIRQSALSA
ncbi:MAG TPA: hypothetical protein VIJ34_07800 [Acidimicrobiales bacterium]